MKTHHLLIALCVAVGITVASSVMVCRVSLYAEQLTEEVYLACLNGSVRPVLRDGTMPTVRTDSGKPIPCIGGVFNDRV